ncbi:ABC transporter permease [Eubacterium oxidoreducens]|uniref:MacB-like core domain-containing protein n=1 Tax=Eubacterium oxidoreducens TaxID=1732 RepID=A0A1G6BQS2_EUBOX|nr:ABC transporter permease [Eubacterium oxidoreducens]SDB22905.1 MacB-like core domain-containing protein [Eubacterium oxidoreducens]
MSVMYKSKLLLLSNIIAASIIIINIFNLVSVYKMISQPADGLSDSYFSLRVESKEDYENMLKAISDDDDFLVERDVAFQVVGVYYDEAAYINPVKGRLFNKQEMAENKLVAMVDESLVDRCITKEDKLYYKFQNDYYEIVGVFRRSENKVNQDAYVYIPLTTALNMQYINEEGEYNIDADAGKFDQEDLIYKNSQLNIKDKLEITINEQEASVIALVVIMVMLLINMIGIINQWRLSRQTMVKAMYLSGVNPLGIKKKLLGEYVTILVIAYIVGLIIACIMTFIPQGLYETFEISVTSVMISFFVYLIFALWGIIYTFTRKIGTNQ